MLGALLRVLPCCMLAKRMLSLAHAQPPWQWHQQCLFALRCPHLGLGLAEDATLELLRHRGERGVEVACQQRRHWAAASAHRGLIQSCKRVRGRAAHNAA